MKNTEHTFVPKTTKHFKTTRSSLPVHEAKQQTMEEERADALEVAA